MATWLVLGATSSIARSFAALAAAKGATLILAARDVPDSHRTATDLRIRHRITAHVLPLDVLSMNTTAFTEQVQALLPAGDTLNIFCAVGDMPEQAEMEADFSLAHRMMAVNLIGVMDILEAFVPMLIAQKGGQVGVISSVAGDRGRRKNYFYGASKAALNTYLAGLRARLFAHGVSVTTLKPGFIDTPMTWGLPGVIFAASPEACASACYRATTRGADVVYIPWFWWGIMTILCLIPERFFKKMNI